MYVMLEDFKNVALYCTFPNGSQRLVTFVPGKNRIDEKVWKALIKSNAEKFEVHYKNVLHPFKSKLDTGCRSHLFDYSEEEMLEIIENVHSVRFLEYLLDIERERRFEYMPRKPVIAALLAKMPPKETDPAELKRLADFYANFAVE